MSCGVVTMATPAAVGDEVLYIGNCEIFATNYARSDCLSHTPKWWENWQYYESPVRRAVTGEHDCIMHFTALLQ